MFGYVRPFRDELKCKDFDLYRATYCGLCRTMRRRYGFLAPMFLNFDFTFLALLLSPAEDRFVPCSGRCHVNPLKTCPMCPESKSLCLAADESIILTYWKLRDSAKDNTGLKRLAAGLLSLFLRPSYRKAADFCPGFDQAVIALLGELDRLEHEKCSSIDRTADTFACLLQAAAPETGDPVKDRPTRLLLYHLGRWIYLIDARDDLDEDRKSGDYNPLLLRFGDLCDDTVLNTTLEHSLNIARSSLNILELGCRRDIIENILCLGLPAIQQAVLDGSWKQMKKQKVWRRNT